MAITYQEYMQKTGCQLVADQLISGFPHHKLLGTIKDEIFTLTEAGQEYLDQIANSPVVEDAEPKTRRGRPRAVAETEETKIPLEG